MTRRRALMSFRAEPSEGLGEYTAGYYALLTPQATNKFTITHNLGVKPKVVIIDADFEPPSGRNALIHAVYAFDVYDYANGNMVFAQYWFSGNLTKYATSAANVTMDAANTEITLPPIYSGARSPWNTSGQYKVRVLG